jgi:hypothetical protein
MDRLWALERPRVPLTAVPEPLLLVVPAVRLPKVLRELPNEDREELKLRELPQLEERPIEPPNEDLRAQASSGVATSSTASTASTRRTVPESVRGLVLLVLTSDVIR